MGKAYFSAATFKFQRDLARNNNRAWFAANKQRYEDVLKEPFLRFIEDMQKPLAKISAHYRADPRPQGGSLFRIYRDTRFRNDKTPYKTWPARASRTNGGAKWQRLLFTSTFSPAIRSPAAVSGIPSRRR